MGREVELKLRLEPEALDRVRRSRRLTPLRQGRPVVKTLRSTYFDTPDMALRGEGVALRVREMGKDRVQTLKSDARAGGLAADRAEYDLDLAPGQAGPDLNRVPDALRLRLGRIAAPGDLEPLFVTDIRRSASRLKTGTGDEIELAVDKGTIRARGRDAPVSEIELELKTGAPASLYRLALDLVDVAPMRIALATKADRGYALATGQQPMAVKAAQVSLPRDASVDSALALVLTHCLRQLMANEPAMIDARSVEGLHQMRVALRRLRSAFTVFRPVLDGEAARALADDAKTLGAALGDARDLDVFLGDLLPPVEAAFDGDPALSALRAAARHERQEAWGAARAAIRSPGFTRFCLMLALFIEERGWRTVKDLPQATSFLLDQPIAGFAATVLTRRLKSAQKLGGQIETLSLAERHELRKRLKKLRYAAGFFAGLYKAKPAQRYLARLADLQDAFGSLNDVVTARHIVEALATAPAGSQSSASEMNLLAKAGGLILGWQERAAHETWAGARNLWRGFHKAAPFWR